MPKPILYSYFRSSASWRVRIALAYKGIDYEYKAVSLIKDGGQQKTAEYQALNPMGQVPTLIIDGETLTQSLPIIEYLEETRPEKSLLPKDPIKRFHARKISEMINSGTQPIQNLSILKKIQVITGKESERTEWGRFWVDKGLGAVESELAKTAGKYCIGDEVTIADIFLLPQLHNAIRFKVDMSQFPLINRITEELAKLDAFKAGDFSNQPDTPDDAK